MKTSQLVSLLELLHSTNSDRREFTIKSILPSYQISAANLDNQTQKVLELFNTGIANLNHNQLKNLIDLTSKGFSGSSVINRLEFYQIESSFHQNILNFLENYKSITNAVEVSELDPEFEGVQVATRDSFDKILNDGYTGDWVLTPLKINPLRVQIASMNEEGIYKRGWYINADITLITPHQNEKIDNKGNIKLQTRYRLHIANPEIINSGNPNVKFTERAVRYITNEKN
jgi:hypothetical protein